MPQGLSNDPPGRNNASAGLAFTLTLGDKAHIPVIVDVHLNLDRFAANLAIGDKALPPPARLVDPDRKRTSAVRAADLFVAF